MLSTPCTWVPDVVISQQHGELVEKYLEKWKHISDIVKLEEPEIENQQVLPLLSSTEGLNSYSSTVDEEDSATGMQTSKSIISADQQKETPTTIDLKAQLKLKILQRIKENAEKVSLSESERKILHPKFFKCNACGEEYSTRHELDHHFAQIHTGGKPLHCAACKKSYKTYAGLVHHLRIEHTGWRLINCDLCDKRFGHAAVDLDWRLCLSLPLSLASVLASHVLHLQV